MVLGIFLVCFMVVLGVFFVVLGFSWWFLVFFVRALRFLVVLGVFSWYFVVLGSSWWFMVILCCSWGFGGFVEFLRGFLVIIYFFFEFHVVVSVFSFLVFGDCLLFLGGIGSSLWLLAVLGG